MLLGAIAPFFDWPRTENWDCDSLTKQEIIGSMCTLKSGIKYRCSNPTHYDKATTHRQHVADEQVGIVFGSLFFGHRVGEQSLINTAMVVRVCKGPTLSLTTHC